MAGQKTISHTYTPPPPPVPPPPEIAWLNPSFDSYSDPENAWTAEPAAYDWNDVTYAFTSQNGKAIFITTPDMNSGNINRVRVFCADTLNPTSPVTVTIYGYLAGTEESFIIAENVEVTGNVAAVFEIDLCQIAYVGFMFNSLSGQPGNLYDIQLGLI